MAQQIAQPTFVTGPSDRLAAVDVYKQQQQQGQVVNSVQNILMKYNPTLARSLSGFSSLDIQSITKAALNMTSVGGVGNSLLQRVMAINPSIGSTIRSMDSAVRDKFSSSLGGVTSGISGMFGTASGAVGTYPGQSLSASYGIGNSSALGDNGFQCTIGDVTSTVKSNDIFQTQQMGSLVNSITGSNSMSFKDTTGQVGLYSSTINQCMDCNISGVTKDVFATIGDRQVLGLVSNQVMPNVVRQSSIDDLFNVASNLYTGQLLAATPGLLSLFSNVFGNTTNRYSNSSQHVYTYAELIRAYDATGPGWNTYIRKTESGNQTVVNIHPLVDGSEKFDEIITVGARNSTNRAEKPYLLAPLIKSNDVQSMLQRQYPGTVFYFDESVKPMTDPRVLNRI